MTKNPTKSLILKYGWKGILSPSILIPRGLFEPVWWRKRKWIITTAAIMKGIKKWNVKNRFNVALSTANPPHTHWTIISPTYGIADRRLVITVAPQNDIWPQGKTYPIKAAPIVKSIRSTPENQVNINI